MTTIDCRKAELDPDSPGGRVCCRWCGRPCKWTYKSKLHHRRGYRRMHPDPRKEQADGDGTAGPAE
jgi:hypothetical protein